MLARIRVEKRVHLAYDTSGLLRAAGTVEKMEELDGVGQGCRSIRCCLWGVGMKLGSSWPTGPVTCTRRTTFGQMAALDGLYKAVLGPTAMMSESMSRIGSRHHAVRDFYRTDGCPACIV